MICVCTRVLCMIPDVGTLGVRCSSFLEGFAGRVTSKCSFYYVASAVREGG